MILAIALILSLFASGPLHDERQRYVEKYYTTAVEEMTRTGVPASITLAQGILESDSGRSPLAVNGNNHFGIKCHSDWKGKRMYRDDDRKGECFRVYADAAESFRDHSDFLRYRDRYSYLFELDPSDYKAWARGLRKAGYATDPAYASKLIRVIEEEELWRFDGVRTGTRETPPPPAAMETPEALSPSECEVFSFATSVTILKLNGVPFIYAEEGDTWQTISSDRKLFLPELLSYNDATSNTPLESGDIVFLRAKKTQAVRGIDKHVVDGPNETLRDISQRYAVKLKSLCKMNGLTNQSALREGDTLKLRKR